MTSVYLFSPSMALTREIKKELLTDVVSGALSERKAKRRVWREARDVKDMIKQESLQKRRSPRTTKQKMKAVNVSDDAGPVNVLPRRPYQWKGRRVRRMLKPGTVVTFTPGQRSARRMRREYDEVHADADILEQAEAREGEFAYGKRRALMTTSNPTPSQVPVTPQTTIAPSEAAKLQDKLLPTVQLLVPRKRKAQDQGGRVEVKMRASESILPGLKVETMDVSIPVKTKEGEQALVASLADTLENNAAAAVAVADAVELESSRKKKRAVRRCPRVPTVSTATVNVIKNALPEARILSCGKQKNHSWADATAFVRYHPSITLHGKMQNKLQHLHATKQRYTKDGKLIPAVVYHPSIMRRH